MTGNKLCTNLIFFFCLTNLYILFSLLNVVIYHKMESPTRICLKGKVKLQGNAH